MAQQTTDKWLIGALRQLAGFDEVNGAEVRDA